MSDITKVASITRDFAEELDRARRLRQEFFSALRKAKSEFSLITDGFRTSEFDQWLQKTYGVKLEYDNMDNITSSYTVVDEKKFMLFTLKFV